VTQAGRRRTSPLRGRLAATAIAGTLSAALAGCGTYVTAGVRPNKPTTPSPTSAYTPADPAKLALPLTSLPGYTAPTTALDGTASRPMTGSPGAVSWSVFDGNSKPLTSADTGPTVAFGPPNTYTDVPGVLTFRGNQERTAPAFGTADVKNKSLTIAWTQDIGTIKGDGSTWPGAGWTGQPLLVNWPAATRNAMGLAPQFANDPNFTEVIYPVFDGHVYRFELATGAETRPPIDAHWGFKGTGDIDPRGYPILYTGQGLNDRNGEKGPWAYRMFDLIQNKEVYGINGIDPVSHRQDWGAFDSSSVVNAASDTLMEPGENGVIYKVKLNAAFDPAAKKVSLDPRVTKMVYTAPTSYQYGIESSEVAYRNLFYATDNDGNLLCWDANTMQVVWTRAMGDDNDSTIALDESSGTPYLYTGNSVGWRGAARHDLVTNLRKVDALTGNVIWQYDLPAYYNNEVKGGLLSTPLLGTGEISDLVIFNVGKTTAPSEGTMVALDKASGKVVWTRHLDKYSWSSPVEITGTDGHAYGVFGDSGGTLHLFDPNTGRDYSSISLGKNIEASVSAYNNMLVVASYSAKVYGIKIS
jgi:PQQ-like domain